MPSRGLIIAIEQYPKSTELAPKLPNVNATANTFFDWLVTTKAVKPSDVVVCAEGANFPGASMFPTARESIMDAVEELVRAGQDATEDLFVFYSGHGFCFQNSVEKRALEILVAGDFVSTRRSGIKCIQLPELQEKLNVVVGGTHHYYFMDFCRTLLREGEIDPIGLGRILGRPAQRSSRPPKSILFSTAYGDPAAVNSKFAPALLDGLRGRGRAKGFTPTGELYVMFPLLAQYVQNQVKNQRVESSDGGGGLIVQIQPVPTYQCEVAVNGATAADQFVARLALARNAALSQTVPFQGPTHRLPFIPDDWILDVLEGGKPLARVKPPAGELLDFFDDCAATYGRPPGGRKGAQPPASTTSRVTLDAPRSMQVRARNLSTGSEVQLSSDEVAELPAGHYEFALQENSSTIRRQTVQLKGGKQDVRFTERADPIRESIIRSTEGDPARGIVGLSETLGWMADPDLTLWLTIMGASHILKDPTTFSKLKQLRLDDFSNLTPYESRVYLLAAVPAPDAPRFAVGSAWQAGRSVAGLVGVFQESFDTQPGPHVVSLQIGSSESRTFAAYCLPNRVTFFVFAPDESGRLRVHQFILPVHSLFRFLDPQVVDRLQLDEFPLRVIRTVHMFQRQFARGRSIEAPDPEQKNTWSDLLHGKWLDPIMSLLAAYEIIRRGDENLKNVLRKEVIPNLERHFAGIPDIAAIGQVLGLDRPVPADPPLLTDGLLAFPGWENQLPLAARKLDYGHVWTTWRGALLFSPGVGFARWRPDLQVRRVMPGLKPRPPQV